MGWEHEPGTVWRAQELYCLDRLSFERVFEATGVATSTLKRWADKYHWRERREELAQVESEIEKLLDTLTGASPVLLSYANSKIEELDARRQSIANEIAKLSADAVPMEKMESISGYLDDWENVSFEDKRQVVDALITVIRATNEKVEIEWKI